ncbi:hypothetical protein [Streptomyces sp. NBC_00859]|uniref:hypothetical protein n=1 Tax=Streptomyces sp. NBC_00859 TaxID=2903682 RepID=UPI00386E667C|nr:hypothetical protein OG584_07615 [Streptomyces sp. NBC_00859]
MEPELAALAAAGASALVQQMTTDAWAGTRQRVAAFFSRGRRGEEEVLDGELEESRADLEDPEAAGDVEAVWRTRLRRTLRNDPAAASELRALLEELSSEAARRGGDVHNVINGGVQHGTVIQTGTVGPLHIDGQGQGRR